MEGWDVDAGVGEQINSSGQPLIRIQRTAVRLHLLSVLSDAAADAVNPGILAAREIVVEEGAGGEDEGVQNDERQSEAGRAPRAGGAGH
jgi:hypothetical protein